jgi:hypothetical protein
MVFYATVFYDLKSDVVDLAISLVDSCQVVLGADWFAGDLFD